MNYIETLKHAWRDHLAPKSSDAPTVISTFAGCGGSSLGYSMAGYRELLAVECDKHAVETFKCNFPEVPIYHGDIGKLSVEQCLEMAALQEGELDVLDGSPPCFPGGTLISTREGDMAIESVQAGDFVLTHCGRYREVESVHSRDYTGELLMIEPRYGRDYITCTPNHPLFAKRRRYRQGDESDTQPFRYPEWIPAQELKPGDLLLEPRRSEHTELRVPLVITKQRINQDGRSGSIRSEYRLLERPCDLDLKKDEIAWVLGLYLAEGHLRGQDPTLDANGPYRRSVIFSVRDTKTEQATARLKQAGLNPYVSQHGERVMRITITDPDFWVLCRALGHYAHGKFIPPTLFSMPLVWQKALLSGYFFGDGCTRHGHGTEITSATTVSSRLAKGIAQLVANVYGVVASLEKNLSAGTHIICGRQVNQRDSYTVRFRLAETRTERLGHVDHHGTWIPIKRVHKTVPVGCRVYNLEVKRHHSYTANGFAVHNCQGFSTSGRSAFTDIRNQLFKEYVRLLRGLRPKVFVMENVSGMVKGKMKIIFVEILRELKASGYHVSVRLLNASHYGVPQARERVIFIGVRNDLGIVPSHPPGNYHVITAKEALQNCAPSEIVPLLGKNLAKMRLIRPGAPYKEKKRASLAVFGKVSGFTLIRFKWNAPAPTVLKTVRISATFGAGLVMPDEDRYVSISELKRLASFPDQFELTGSFEQRWARIGNSVPPLLMRSIALHIRNAILNKGQGVALQPQRQAA